MATHKSALKKSKQDLVRRARNRADKSRLRTALKKFRTAVANGETVVDQIPVMASLIDRSAKKGVIHRNAANRLKSQVTKAAAATA